jgi:PAS domain S-box-containing protein
MADSAFLNRKTIALNIVLAAVYIFAGKMGLLFAFENPSASPIWAPTGIALAALLIGGVRVVPAIFFGAFFVNFTTAGTLVTSLAIAIGNTLEAIVGAYFVNKFAHGVNTFERVADIFKFTFLAGLIATTISANIGILTLIISGLTTWQSFLPVWLTWWFGNMGGSLIITPLILVWWTHARIPFSLNHALHFLVSFLAIFLITWLIFAGIVPYPYLYIPIAVWIAFWFGRRGATTATILVAFITISQTLSGHGPFAMDSLTQSLLQLQLFLNIFSLTALIFAATVLEIRKSEKTIATHEQRFQSLIENSFDAIVLIDATSRILYASPSVKRVLGYTPEELRGMPGFDLVAPEDKKLTMGTLAELVLKPGGNVTIEYRVVRKDKTIIWTQATGTNLLLEQNINAVVVNFHDITAKKLAEQKLFQEKIENQEMLRSIGDGIIATDKKGLITMINKAACDMLGWKYKELLGKPLVQMIPLVDEADEAVSVNERPMTKMLTQGKKVITSRTNAYLTKDKRRLPVHFTLSPIVIDDAVVGTIEVFRDITKEKEIDKAKSEFVSIASHQLRTPLSIINWCIEELKRKNEGLTTAQRDFLDKTYQASKRMGTLIDALLNASRLELGTLVIETTKLDLLAIIRQVLQDLRPQQESKQITIQEVYQEGLPPFPADAKLFTIIIQNLLSNAIKYGKTHGKIVIKISLTNELLIEVTDDGFGIPQHQQTKIYTKLFRADNARSMQPEGTGLGLYIVKEIVEASNGKIWFTSRENEGTSFFISYPLSGMQKRGKIKPGH